MLSDKIFGVISLGCDKNRVDSEKLLGLIKERGYTLTDDLAKAQIVIVNTCAFLQSAREEAIETVFECADYKNGKLEKLVVTGCLPQKFIGELYAPLQDRTFSWVSTIMKKYSRLWKTLTKTISVKIT